MNSKSLSIIIAFIAIFTTQQTFAQLKSDPPEVVNCNGNCPVTCDDGSCWPKDGTLATGGVFQQCQTTDSKIIDYLDLVKQQPNTTYRFYTAAVGGNEIARASQNFNLNSTTLANGSPIWVTATETGKLESERVRIDITVNPAPHLSYHDPYANLNNLCGGSGSILILTDTDNNYPATSGTWSSSNPDVATVDWNTLTAQRNVYGGEVTAVSSTPNETTNITYTTLNGCSASIPARIVDCYSLTITIAPAPIVCVGEEWSYNVKVENNSTDPALGLVVVLADNAAGTTTSQSPNDIFTVYSVSEHAGSSFSTATATWTIGDLDAGTSATLKVTGTLKTTATTSVNLKAYAADVNGTQAETYNKSQFKDIQAVTPGASVPVLTIDDSHSYSRCGEGEVTLGVIANPSTASVSWYADGATSAPIINGFPELITPISTDTAFYAEARIQLPRSANDPAKYCSSKNPDRLRVPVKVHAMPAAINVTPANRCGTGIVTLGAETSTATDIIKWYSTDVSTTVLETGTSYITPSITQSTTYYAEAWTPYVENTVTQYCVSPSRQAVTATIKGIPQVTTVEGDAICGPGLATLTILNATMADVTYTWYEDAAMALSPVFGPSTYAQFKPTLTTTGTKTFYIVPSKDGCTGSVTQVQAQVKAVPVTAIAGTEAARSTCGPGEVTLGATANQSLIYWYATEEDAQLANGDIDDDSDNRLHIGATYSPTINGPSSVTYYARAVGTNDCLADNILPITAVFNAQPTVSTTISTNPNDYNVCGSGTVTLTATSDDAAATFKWYLNGVEVSTANPYTPSISTTTTYEVEAIGTNGCVSANKASVTATVNDKPSVSTTVGTNPDDYSVCGSGTVTLTATSDDATATFKWYLNGVEVSTANPYTPSISATTTYEVEAIGSNGCVSANKASVTATIKDLPSVSTTIGTNPDDYSVCGSGTVTLTATSDDNTATFKWYLNGVLVSTANPYTPSIIANTTYEVEAVGGNGCISANKASVTATIKEQPSVSTTIGTNPDDYSICGGGTVTLTATSDDAAATFKWYVKDGDGTVVSTANPYTPSISATTTYEVEAVGDNGCVSADKASVTATVNDKPSVSTTIGANPDDYSVCGSGTVTLTAVSDDAAASFKWYQAGTLVSTANPYQPTISAVTTYEVEAIGSNGCVSANKASVTATIKDKPSVSTTIGTNPDDYSVCGSGSVTLTATSDDAAATFKWYLNGAEVSTANPYQPTISAVTTYEVEAIGSNGCVSANKASVTATIKDKPSVSTTIGTNPDDYSVCGSGSVTLTATSDDAAATFNWYRDGGLVYTGNPYTPTITTTTTYEVEAVGSNGCTSTARSQVTATVSYPPVFTSYPQTTLEYFTAPEGSSVIVNYPVVLDNTTGPATLTYLFEGATTGSGTGTGSGLRFSEGTTKVTVTATAAPCTATAVCVFEIRVIKGIDMNDVSVTVVSIANQTYTGNAIKPNLIVANGTTLSEGTDYTIKYDNNTNSGTATITITGMGRYSGSRIVIFTIDKAQPVILANDTVANYTGNPVELAYELTGSSTVSELSGTLKFTYEGVNGTVYIPTETPPTEEGEYIVRISTPGNANHSPAETEILLQIILNVSIDDILSETFHIYPNPVNKNSKLRVNNGQWSMDNGDVWVEVYNLRGQLLRQISITGKQTELRSESVEGTYLYVVKSKAGILDTVRIVVK